MFNTGVTDITINAMKDRIQTYTERISIIMLFLDKYPSLPVRAIRILKNCLSIYRIMIDSCEYYISMQIFNQKYLYKLKFLVDTTNEEYKSKKIIINSKELTILEMIIDGINSDYSNLLFMKQMSGPSLFSKGRA